MMNIFNTVRLYEGIAQARRQYVDTGKISLEDFNELKNIDKTPKKKYIEWIVKNYVEKTQKQDKDEVINDISKIVDTFDELVELQMIPKEDSDIYQYTYDTLKKYLTQDTVDVCSQCGFDALVKGHNTGWTCSNCRSKNFTPVKASKMEVIKSKEVWKKQTGPEYAPLVFEDEYMKVHKMLSFPIFNKICGGKTNWCTSKSYATWESYLRRGDLFYLVRDKKYEDDPKKGWWAVTVNVNGKKTTYPYSNPSSGYSYEHMVTKIKRGEGSA
jgi:ribosomal protein L37AE/L43A